MFSDLFQQDAVLMDAAQVMSIQVLKYGDFLTAFILSESPWSPLLRNTVLNLQA